MARSPEDAELLELPDVLPLLPLSDTVVFPFVIVPLSVGPDRGALAIDRALSGDRLVLLVSQRDPDEEEPGPGDFHAVGTVAMIMRMLKLPDGRLRILVQGVQRVRIESVTPGEDGLQARIAPLDESSTDISELEAKALLRSVQEGLERAVHLGRTVSPEVMVVAANLESSSRLADLVASNLDLAPDEAQLLLETADPIVRLQKVGELLAREVELLEMQHHISAQARDEIEKSQREFYLRQQIKAIQEELGEDDEISAEVAAYRSAVAERNLPEEARVELDRQLRRLERSHPDSAETAVVRTWLDWMTGLPWDRVSEDRLDLDDAQEILDEDHWDLEKVKARILEMLAVRKLAPEARGPILCLVGPPGVGKTSLGRSIARALGRGFVRISLGGVRDEAEIRGHRRTYVGALPGRILQGLYQAGTSNPVFMLDEIDKIGADSRGDPSSALLEVLDPEQNHAFRDHYLGVSYDLSKVLFLTTANLLDPIQPAFLDRMEVLSLTGYTEEEKLEIARRHLLPKQLRANGLEPADVRFGEPALRRIIRGYTREAGLRNLEREIAAVCRKLAVDRARGRTGPRIVTRQTVEKMLGPERHFHEALLDRDRVGVATGLAWTATGGDLLFLEVVALAGSGKLHLTGRLGDVMKESAQAARTVARAWATHRDLDPDFFSKNDLHLHAPAGSIPKDGPSAGVPIVVALVSALTGTPVRRDVAMTGEITLRGEILPVGGVREKTLAARTGGLLALILPRLNRRDVEEIPAALRRGMVFHYVDHVDDVVPLALAPADDAER